MVLNRDRRQRRRMKAIVLFSKMLSFVLLVGGISYSQTLCISRDSSSSSSWIHILSLMFFVIVVGVYVCMCFVARHRASQPATRHGDSECYAVRRITLTRPIKTALPRLHFVSAGWRGVCDLLLFGGGGGKIRD